MILSGVVAAVRGVPIAEIDPYWDNVVLAMHMDGVNGSTVFTDKRGHTVTPYGNAKIITDVSAFGGSSAYFDGTDYTRLVVEGAIPFGLDDLTIEMFVTFNTLKDSAFFTRRSREWSTSAEGINLMLIGGKLGAYITNAPYSWKVVIQQNGSIVIGDRYHVELDRKNGTYYLFVNGNLIGSQYFNTLPSEDSTVSGTTIGGSFGTYGGSTFTMNGRVDDLRITKGVARHIANFTPPTETFPDQ